MQGLGFRVAGYGFSFFSDILRKPRWTEGIVYWPGLLSEAMDR